MENEQEPKITIDQLAGMMANGFAEMHDRFEKVDARFDAIDVRLEGADHRFAGIDKRLDLLNQKIDRVDAKVEAHRQETKDGFAGLHRVVGGMSHTLADHEERLTALEGE